MAALTDKDLIKEFKNSHKLIIHPFDEKCITGVGYDLKIGIIKPLSEIEKFKEDETKIYIPPKAYCLVITKEFVWLSGKLIGTLHARGTLAAKGLFTNSTNVDPNFKGQMIMSVCNLSNADIVVNKEDTFITLIFHKANSRTDTLVGDEGTKNSMRVISQLKNEIYIKKDFNDKTFEMERNSIQELQDYLTYQNEVEGQVFLNRIMYTQTINKKKLLKWWTNTTAYFKNLVENRVSFVLILLIMGLVCYFLWSLFMDKTKPAGLEDNRLVAAFLIVLFSLVEKLIPKKK